MRKICAIFAVFSASLFLISCSFENGPTTTQEDHFQADGMVLLDEEFDAHVTVWRGKVSDTIHVHQGCKSTHLQVRFLDQDSALVNPPDEEGHTLGWSFGDSMVAGLIRHEGDIWEFHVEGLQEGTTTLKLSMMHEDHADFSTPVIPVVVEEAVAECPSAHMEH